MNEIRVVSSLDSADLQPYRTLRRAADHVEQGIFVAEGEKVVRRLLESDLRVISLLMTNSLFQQFKQLVDARKEDGIRTYVAERALLETIVGFSLHQGIMAVAEIPEPQSLESIILSKQTGLFMVAVDGIANSANLGIIVRNCAAFGVDALVVGETACSPYLRRSVRMSMGAIFRLPVVHVEHLSVTLRELSERHGTRTIAAEPDKAALSSFNQDFSGNICLVFGSEGSGSSRAVLEVCRERVKVQTSSSVGSLNVASASAILLYEASRQRK